MEKTWLKLVDEANMKEWIKVNSREKLYSKFFRQVKLARNSSWTSHPGEQGPPVIADVIGYGDPVPERSYGRELSGNIPRIVISQMMSIEDYNEYKRLEKSANGEEDKRDALKLAFKDLDLVCNRLDTCMEWMAMRFFSCGGFKLKRSDNKDIFTMDCGIPDDNRSVSMADWSNESTANGLQDIVDTIEKASQRGRGIKYVAMRSDDFELLKKQKSTIEIMQNRVTMKSKSNVIEEIEDYLRSQVCYSEQLVIIPIESSIDKRKTISPWERGRVAFLEDAPVGSIQYGPILEENIESYREKTVMVKMDFFLAMKYHSLKHEGEMTKLIARAIPVIDDPEGLFILKTDGRAWTNDTDTVDRENLPTLESFIPGCKLYL